MRTTWLIAALAFACLVGTRLRADPPANASVLTDEQCTDQYNQSVAQAQHAYWQAVAQADQTYIDNLTASIQKAMQNQDLPAVEKLDQTRKAALVAELTHQAYLDGKAFPTIVGPPAGGGLVVGLWHLPPGTTSAPADNQKIRLMSATWGDSQSSIDVTEKIKPILLQNDGKTLASADLFGDTTPGKGKYLVIHYGYPNPNISYPPQHPKEHTCVVEENSPIVPFARPWEFATGIAPALEADALSPATQPAGIAP